MYFNRHTLLTFLCAVILVVSSQKTNGSQLDRQANEDVLKVGVYFESLCPDSKAFITTQLYPAFGRLAKYLEVNFVPYGNAESVQTNQNHGGKWSFKCQHAIHECTANMYIACLLQLDSLTQEQKIEIVNCVMGDSRQWKNDATLKCMDSLNLNDKLLKMSLVHECAVSHFGEELLLGMGMETDALIPPHTFIPWITFNGVSNPEWQEEARGNFEGFICEKFLPNVLECKEDNL